MTKSEFYDVTTSGNVLEVTLKGFWQDSQVDEIGKSLGEDFFEAVDSFEKNRFLVIANLSDFGIPSEKAKVYIGNCMKYGLDNGLHKSVEVLPKAMTRIGIEQAAKSTSNDDFRVKVKSLPEAYEKIETLKEEL